MATISLVNSRSPLSGTSFIGTTVDVRGSSTVSVGCIANVNGTISVRQSFDGINWDKTDTLSITADTYDEIIVYLTLNYLSVTWSSGVSASSGRIITKIHATSLSETTSSASSSVAVTDVIPGTGATKLGKAVSNVAGSTDTGVAVLGVRRDTVGEKTDITEANGDYTYMRMNQYGAIYTTSQSTYWAGVDQYTEGVTGATMVGAVRNDTLAALANQDNEIAPLQVDSSGALYVTIGSSSPGTGSTNLGKAVSAAAGSTDTGVATLALRADELVESTTIPESDGDYTLLRVNKNGALFVIPVGVGTHANGWDDYDNTTGDSEVPVYSTVLDCQNLKCVGAFGQVYSGLIPFSLTCTVTMQTSMNNSNYYDTGVSFSVTDGTSPVTFYISTGTFAGRYCRLKLLGLCAITATVTAKG